MPALDLKAVREALARARGRLMTHGISHVATMRECDQTIAALDSHLSLSEYDRAVSDLAQFFPDCDVWVAQWESGRTTLHADEPKIVEPSGSWLGKWRGISPPIEHQFTWFPMCPDWRTSLRLIRGGVVQGGGE